MKCAPIAVFSPRKGNDLTDEGNGILQKSLPICPLLLGSISARTLDYDLPKTRHFCTTTEINFTGTPQQKPKRNSLRCVRRFSFPPLSFFPRERLPLETPNYRPLPPLPSPIGWIHAAGALRSLPCGINHL